MFDAWFLPLWYVRGGWHLMLFNFVSRPAKLWMTQNSYTPSSCDLERFGGAESTERMRQKLSLISKTNMTCPRPFCSPNLMSFVVAGYENSEVQNACPDCRLDKSVEDGIYNLIVRNVRLGEDENYECQVSPGKSASNSLLLRAHAHITIQGKRRQTTGH